MRWWSLAAAGAPCRTYISGKFEIYNGLGLVVYRRAPLTVPGVRPEEPLAAAPGTKRAIQQPVLAPVCPLPICVQLPP